MSVALLGMIFLMCTSYVHTMDNTLSPSMGLTLSPASVASSNPSLLALSGGGGSETASIGSYQSGSYNSSTLKPSLGKNGDLVLQKETEQETVKKQDIKKDPMNQQLQMIVTGEKYYCDPAGRPEFYLAAFACFERVAKQSQDLRAKAWGDFYVGSMYANGCGMEQDVHKANEHLKLAARQKLDLRLASKAALALGDLYCKLALNESNERNYLFNAARFCFEQVIENVQADDDARATACVHLGLQYEDAEGVPQDYQKAFAYYQKVAGMNLNIEAVFAAKLCLCDLAYQGQGTPKNYKLALSYCEQVIKHGASYPGKIAKAKLRRGLLYSEGNYGINQNMAFAHKDLTEVMNQKDDLVAAQEATNRLNHSVFQGMQHKIKKE